MTTYSVHYLFGIDDDLFVIGILFKLEDDIEYRRISDFRFECRIGKLVVEVRSSYLYYMF